jgi:hypothetical protein
MTDKADEECTDHSGHVHRHHEPSQIDHTHCGRCGAPMEDDLLPIGEVLDMVRDACACGNPSVKYYGPHDPDCPVAGQKP